MASLLWMIANMVAAAILLYGAYRGAKWVNGRYGVIAGCCFAVLVLYAFCCLPSNSAQDRPLVRQFRSSAGIAYFRRQYDVAVLDNPVFTVHLLLATASDKDRLRQEPLTASTQMTGAMGYQRWIPLQTDIHSGPKGLTYSVSGLVDWNLIGYPVYREPVVLTGNIKPSWN